MRDAVFLVACVAAVFAILGIGVSVWLDVLDKLRSNRANKGGDLHG